MKRFPVKLRVGVSFVIAGIILIVAGILVNWRLNEKIPNGIQTIGTVIEKEIDSNDSVVVVIAFIDSTGKEIIVKSHNDAFYRRGEELKIIYDEYNPKKYKIVDNGFYKSMFYILIIVGICLLLISIIVIIKALKEGKRKQILKETGSFVNGKIIGIKQHKLFTKKGKKTYILFVKFNYNNVDYVIKSEDIWDNPDVIIRENEIYELPIYVDINDPRKSIVEITSITEKMN